MRLRSIWTAPYIPFAERIERSKDSICLTIANKMPQRLRYWTGISVIGRATKDAPEVPAANVSYILEHMEDKKPGKPYGGVPTPTEDEVKAALQKQKEPHTVLGRQVRVVEDERGLYVIPVDEDLDIRTDEQKEKL